MVAGSCFLGFILRFFLLVTALSFAELYLLIELAQHFSVVATLALCILTGVVGGAMVRAQGLSTLTRIRASLAQADLPGEDIVAGLILLSMGILLLTPGFITDTVAFAMLVPPLRRAVAVRLSRRFAQKTWGKSRRQKTQAYHRQTSNPHQGKGFTNPADVVIEVDAREP